MTDLLLFFLFRTHYEGLAESCTCTVYSRCKQYCGSGYRIHLAVLDPDPDPGDYKMTKIYKLTWFPACPYVLHVLMSCMSSVVIGGFTENNLQNT